MAFPQQQRKINHALAVKVSRVNEDPERLLEKNAELEQVIASLRQALKPLRNIGMTPQEAVDLIEELQGKVSNLERRNQLQATTIKRTVQSIDDIPEGAILIAGVPCVTQAYIAQKLGKKAYQVSRAIKKLPANVRLTMPGGKRKLVRYDAIEQIKASLTK